jgi:hypothetical protein
VSIAIERSLAPELVEPAWTFYNRAFAELRTTAVQRHVMYREEFDHVMKDERVWKYRGYDPGDPLRVTALATFSNELESMPLISPEYFAHHWPQLYLERRVWYLGFFAVDPTDRGSGLFAEVIGQLWERVLDTGGIAVLDICRRNEQRGLAAAIHRTLLGLTPQMRASRADEQTYWVYEP